MWFYLNARVCFLLRGSEPNTNRNRWRRTMEDAHDARVDMEVDGKKFSFFGVFDGHGGDQVALYCEDGYYNTLTKNEFFKKGDYTKALEQTNIEVDEQLKTEEVNAVCMTHKIEMFN